MPLQSCLDLQGPGRPLSFMMKHSSILRNQMLDDPSFLFKVGKKGALPPWRNSDTHDTPHRTSTQLESFEWEALSCSIAASSKQWDDAGCFGSSIVTRFRHHHSLRNMVMAVDLWVPDYIASGCIGKNLYITFCQLTALTAFLITKGA
ncbi:hypothetical protein S83_030606 [Arachis hypogaea]|nr:uncharacterized protein LOC112712681 [Arachis hypogaea]